MRMKLLRFTCRIALARTNKECTEARAEAAETSVIRLKREIVHVKERFTQKEQAIKENAKQEISRFQREQAALELALGKEKAKSRRLTRINTPRVF